MKTNRNPIQIDGLNSTHEINGYEFLVSRGGSTLNVKIPVVGKRDNAPKFIRECDTRSCTMKVLGKHNPNSVLINKSTVSSDGITPHFGNARGHPKGLLSSDRFETKGPIMPQPDNQIGDKLSKLSKLSKLKS